MNAIYKKLVRPRLFRKDPEEAHAWAAGWLERLSGAGPLCEAMRKANAVRRAEPIELFGVSFPNAVGLAAGMDKNARFWRAAGALGFGHVEIGTVTRHPQEGNPKPRLFRLQAERGLINRMGFNNEGAEAVAARLADGGADTRRGVVLGANIGKSKITPLAKAVEDYVFSFKHLAPYVDYVTINVSSPNTEGLRELQAKEQLAGILNAVQEANHSFAAHGKRRPLPILVKIAPDLTYPQIDAALETLETCGCAGIITTNTTIARPGSTARLRERGGLSGEPLRPMALAVVNYVHRATGGKLPIIGVGGISGPVSAGMMIDAGAAIVQLYSGMIYEGPFIGKEIARSLSAKQKEWIGRWPGAHSA